MLRFGLAFAVLLLISCKQEAPVNVAEKRGKIPTEQRTRDFAKYTLGGKLFQRHCAVCHGVSAEGHPQWQTPDSNGNYPPPPLNGSAHAWHHPKKVLMETVRDGTAKLGGKMPAWSTVLSDQEIDAIIYWFQAYWPDDIYAAWLDMDRLSKQGLTKPQ